MRSRLRGSVRPGEVSAESAPSETVRGCASGPSPIQGVADGGGGGARVHGLQDGAGHGHPGSSRRHHLACIRRIDPSLGQYREGSNGCVGEALDPQGRARRGLGTGGEDRGEVDVARAPLLGFSNVGGRVGRDPDMSIGIIGAMAGGIVAYFVLAS